MPLKISSICLMLLLLMTSTTLEAQKKTKKKDPKKETEQVEAPPEVEKLEATPDEPVGLSLIEEPKLELDTTAAPNDELTAAIKELMRITGAMEIGRQMQQNVRNSFSDKNVALPREFFDKLYKAFDNEDVNRWMANAIVKIYRDKFTLDEVKTITEFYNTPVGKKLITQLPQITQESWKMGEQIGKYVSMKVIHDLFKEGALK